MARTALVPTKITVAGVVSTLAAANVDGHVVPLTDGTYIEVKNGSVASINVTVQTPVTVGGRAVADDVIAVAAGATKKIALDKTVHGQTAGADRGKAYIDFSAVTTVTCAAFDR